MLSFSDARLKLRSAATVTKCVDGVSPPLYLAGIKIDANNPGPVTGQKLSLMGPNDIAADRKRAIPDRGG